MNHAGLFVLDLIDDGQQKSGRFAGARLRAGDEVSFVQDDRNGLFLDGGGFLKADGVQSIEQVVIEL